MKAIILMMTATLGCYATLVNMEHLAKVQKQVASGLPEALPKIADNDNNTPPSENAAPPVSALTSVSELTRQHGEPTRTERATDGTTVYYYPYYVVYVRNYVVISSRRLSVAPAAVVHTSPNVTAGRLWGNSNLNGTTVNGVNAAPATTNPGWQAHNSSLGSVSLNGGGVSYPATTNPGWQGTSASVRSVSAPRTVVRSSGAAQYRSSGATGTAGSGQWAH
ncbi:MAG TPA: hypothetical protein VK961_00985 [Chthoniobacter sp.]|nr:hypothetical protein [Chthoniobacter sp.]